MTSDCRRGEKRLLCSNSHTVSPMRQKTAEWARTRRGENLHVSLTTSGARSLIWTGAEQKWSERAPGKAYFYVFKSRVERARCALRSRIQCTLLLEAAGTSATDERNQFGWTAEATSFPQTPNLAALLSHTAPQRLQRLRAARPPCRATFRSDGAFTGGAASVEWKSDLDVLNRSFGTPLDNQRS